MTTSGFGIIDLAWWQLGLALLLVAVVAIISLRQALGLERDLLVGTVRTIAQLYLGVEDQAERVGRVVDAEAARRELELVAAHGVEDADRVGRFQMFRRLRYLTLKLPALASPYPLEPVQRAPVMMRLVLGTMFASKHSQIVQPVAGLWRTA